MVTFEYFFILILVQVWLKVELKIDCRSNFGCVVTVYAWHIFQYNHLGVGYTQKNSQNKNALSDFIFTPSDAFSKSWKGTKFLILT